MNESDEKIETTSETLNKLISLIANRDVAAEKRATKTDDKIDKLIDSVTVLNISYAEHQKDNKEIFKTLERHETNQKDQGVKLGIHSETLAAHEVKINSSKSTIREILTPLIAIAVAVFIGKAT